MLDINHYLEMRGKGEECLHWPLLKILAVDEFKVPSERGAQDFQASLLTVHSASALAGTGHSLPQSSESGPHETDPMKLVYVLIFTVFFLSQVTPGCGYSDMHKFCDSMISVCLRRKKHCIFRMPGLCPGRSFCCIRVK
uniref:Uncharacterized protein n=1 Tax=Pipistrellus kuhlii TaxID=59472 RepID=A0A7J7SEL5_PIPKU|nr:hypothetical protein mPipKuh1_010012 [Pipistrellus kuhlii]